MNMRHFLCIALFIHAALSASALPDFLWGAALSEYQVSGSAVCPKSNWSSWEKKLKDKSGDACQFWDRYLEDIAIMKKLGIQSLRFSIEWCIIEPEPGNINYEALEHYRQLLLALKQAGIEPMITLHHFVHPLWFERKGGFAKEQNLAYFEQFCTLVFSEFSDLCRLWVIINEPTIFAFQGYVRGVFPPGKTNILKAWTVLKNMVQAHVQVYQKLKSMPGGQNALIGFNHQYLVFEPYSAWNPLEAMPGFLFNRLLNTSVVDFLKTGTFVGVQIPGLTERYEAPHKRCYDFIGLNYYSRAVLKSQFSLTEPLVPACKPGEIMTDMPYAIYPQGLYDALMDLHETGMPIYVTENGIADHGDNRRQIWIQTYTDALLHAKEDGVDVRGYYYWSLLDNYEWDFGWKMQFGLVGVDRETKERTIKPSAWLYADIIRRYKRSQSWSLPSMFSDLLYPGQHQGRYFFE